MARIVLNTFGSFGDLHPFLAIAIELRRRGHDALIATSEIYRAKVEAEGVLFKPVRPDIGQLLGDDTAFIEKLWDPRRGTEHLLRDYLGPQVEASYQDLADAAHGADLLLTHSAALAGPTVAEALGLRWLSLVLQPSMFLSACDPPVLPEAWIRHLYRFGRPVRRAIFAFGRRRVRSWLKPVLALRRRLGLTTSADPLFRGSISPHGTLALFSREFAPPQPDWPAKVTVTGFVFYDRQGPAWFSSGDSRPAESKAKESLSAFLASGAPPVVFTLGSSAVTQAGSFFSESLRAVQTLGIRAVLLTGGLFDPGPGTVSPEVHITPYAPYSELLPRAAATVHQGGIGTTAQALRAGRPMIVVPWAHDQPDNAERVRKLGVSRTMSRRNYTASRTARELRALLANTDYANRAQALGRLLEAENGTRAACDAIERALLPGADAR